MLRIVQAQAQTFSNKPLDKLRERLIDLHSGKTVFVVSDSILLKNQIEAFDKIGTSIFAVQFGEGTPLHQQKR